jgi:hypothetical protein
MYHTLDFSDNTVFVDNNIDSVFILKYNLIGDTLILEDNESNITKEKILHLTKDTLVINSFGKHQKINGYSKIKREWKNE